AEVLDGLRLAIFEKIKVGFGQVGNDGGVLVFHVEEDVDHIHVSAQGGHRLLVLILIILRRRLLRAHPSRKQKDGNYPADDKKRSTHSEGLWSEVGIVSLDAETPLTVIVT